MATYKLEGRTFTKIKFTSLFETNNLVNYGVDNKILNEAFDLEIWEILSDKNEGMCLLLQLENGVVRHGRELYEKLYQGVTEVPRKEAALALPLLSKNKDTVVLKKHKLVRRAA
jgi:hypothetical protein